MRTRAELLKDDMIINYRVEYECVETSKGWGNVGATNAIIFDYYDLKKFTDYAPSNWEIRKIEPFERPDR